MKKLKGLTYKKIKSGDRCERILIIDDDIAHGRSLKFLLEGLNHKVARVESGESGLEYLSVCQEMIALILLDIDLPGISGLEVLSIMKEHPKLKKIPIILQSGESVEELQKGMKMGASGYIQKPYTREALYSAIEQIKIKEVV